MTIVDGQGRTTTFVDTDTNTKNETKISSTKDARGVMSIKVQETTKEFSNGVQISETTETNTIDGIASTQYNELKAENAAIKAEIAEVKAENAEIKAQNEEIKAELAELKAMIKAMKDAKQG